MSSTLPFTQPQNDAVPHSLTRPPKRHGQLPDLSPNHPHILPHAHAKALLNSLSILVETCHRRYARYAEMDSLNAQSLLQSLATAPPLTPPESSALATPVGDSDWRRIRNTIQEPVDYFQRLSESDTATAWGKATAVVDSSAAEVFSYLWNYCSYERVIDHDIYEKGRLRHEITLAPHSKLMLAAKVFPGHFEDRVFTAYMVWHLSSSGEIVIAFGAPTNPSDIAAANAIIAASPRASKAVRAATRGLWRLTPLSSAVSRITLIQQGFVGGSIPLWILNLRIQSTLEFVAEIQGREQRNGREVDAEARAEFPVPPRLEQLDQHQKLIVDAAVAVEQGIGGELVDWTPITSPSPFVKMWLRLPARRKGGRQLGIGRSSTIIDCSPQEALAWWFDYASRERVKISREKGNPARLVVTDIGPHDKVVATIKRATFMVHSREFVMRQLCVTDEGVPSWFLSSVDDKVDYGFNSSAVRGESIGVARFNPVEGRPDQCELHYVQFLDPAGHVPAFILNARVSTVLKPASEIRERFEKDDEVDRMERGELARIIKDVAQTYTAEEDDLIDNIHAKFDVLEWKDFDELEPPDHRVKMGKIHSDGSGTGFVRASTIADDTIEECATWEISQMSRGHVKSADSIGRSLQSVNEHHSVMRVVRDFKIPGFQPREFVSAQIWRRQGDNLEVVYCNTKHVDFPLNPSLVRGISFSLYEYEKLPPVEGLPQTRVTYTQQLDLGGAIPKFAVDGKAVQQLMYLSILRKRFDKSLEIDGGVWTRNVNMIMEHEDEYSVEEMKLLGEGKKQFAVFNEKKAKTLKMPSPLTTAKMVFQGRDTLRGWATTTVRSSPEEVLGFLWDFTRLRFAVRKDDAGKAVDENPNAHNQLLYRKVKGLGGLSDRDFVTRCIWKMDDEGHLFWTTIPEESEKRPPGSNSAVRGSYSSSMRLKRKNDKETTIEFVFHLTVGGDVPSFILNFGVVRQLERSVTAIQEFFQELRGLEEWDEDDGRAVGEVMCIKTKAEKHHQKGKSKAGARMRDLFKKHKGLREIAEKYEFFQPMMTRVIENKLGTAGMMNAPLCDVSKKEGSLMARGLAMSLATNLTAETGVDEWILKYRSLKQLDKEAAWFRPMMNVVGKRLLGEVSWGLKMRVLMGAGLSIMDMATDIFVIVGYMEKKETRGYGYALLGMIALSMAVQLLMVYGQHRKKPLTMLRETLIVLTGMKPGFDAFNVCSGKQMEEHHVIDAKMELLVAKSAEMVCESIPGSILQIYAILQSGEAGRNAVVSVAVSTLTTGFSSASISFDMDVDPENRKLAPEFYGFIPDDGKRTVIFGCMILNSALLLFLRGFSAAMLMLVNIRYFLVYMVGDMALYLLLKVARGDFLYWFPLDGLLGIFVSLLMRTLAKTIVDFTGAITFRHSYELGGLYWSVNMFTALLASFASVWIGGGGKTAWTVVCYSSGAWLTTSGLVLLLMKMGYRKTFFSSQTGKEFSMDYFLKGRDDETKSAVVECHKQHWAAIKGEVKEWVVEGWWRWKQEKPKWFTESWIAKLPIDFVAEANVAEEVALGGERVALVDKRGNEEEHAD